MDDDSAAAAKRAKGSIKEAIGKLTGDTRTQAEGAVQKRGGENRDPVRGGDDAAPNVINK